MAINSSLTKSFPHPYWPALQLLKQAFQIAVEFDRAENVDPKNKTVLSPAFA